MRLTVIGCSGSFPGPDSPASCYLVEAEDAAGRTWRVLLDLGSGALGPLQHHVRLRDLDAVWLTHLHADHCLDLCGLYVALNYDPAGRRPSRLPVTGPAGTLERLVEAYGAEAGEVMPQVYDVGAWRDGEELVLGPLRVTPWRMEHPIEAYGLRVEGPDGEVLAYTGDTDTCDNLGPLARDADVLLAEAAFVTGRDSVRGLHLTGTRAGEAADAAGARRLVLTHLPAWNDPEVARAEAEAVYAGPVDVAHSSLVLSITPGASTVMPHGRPPQASRRA